MTRYQQEMDRILLSNFEPDQSYASLLIKNGNTFDYAKVYKREQLHPCDCQESTYQEFSDSLMQQPLSGKTHYVYNKEHLLIESRDMNGSHMTSKLNYIRDDYGLIQKLMINNENGKTLTWFVYESDRYYKVTLKDEVPVAYETFYLWDLRSSYDHLGRLIKESTHDSELIYQYLNDEEDVYTKFSYYSLSPKKLVSINEMAWDNNRQMITGKTADLVSTFKYIRHKEDNCKTCSYVYNENDQLMSTTLEACN
ncbi:hypothetical protein AQ505_04600 [Pedobacter sp. PACM 27299]|nr:hypothetical protein AQ505_04600 [Pedobacter sp. PACM 27299]